MKRNEIKLCSRIYWNIDLQTCFTCHLPDCTDGGHCPIVQADLDFIKRENDSYANLKQEVEYLAALVQAGKTIEMWQISRLKTLVCKYRVVKRQTQQCQCHLEPLHVPRMALEQGD